MADPNQALANQLTNIQTKTGRTLEELGAAIRATGLEKHGQRVAWCKEHLGLGHGDANTLVHVTAQASAPSAEADPADAWYAGPKAALRPIHDAIVAAAADLGSDVEQSPKKTTLSLRRKKQFALVGPATKTQVELGFNLKGAEGDDRVQALPPGGMCSHRIRLASVEELDEAVLGWLRRAYEAAG